MAGVTVQNKPATGLGARALSLQGLSMVNYTFSQSEECLPPRRM